MSQVWRGTHADEPIAEMSSDRLLERLAIATRELGSAIVGGWSSCLDSTWDALRDEAEHRGLVSR